MTKKLTTMEVLALYPKLKRLDLVKLRENGLKYDLLSGAYYYEYNEIIKALKDY